MLYMGIRILGGVLINEGPDRVGACLYQSTNNVAFGPIFRSTDEAQDFLDWFIEQGDPRLMTSYLVEHASQIYQEEWLPLKRALASASCGGDHPGEHGEH